MGLFKKIGRWAKRRATERSTIVGAATIVAGVVAPKIGLPVDQTASILATVIGGVLIGSTTSNHTPLEERAYESLNFP